MRILGEIEYVGLLKPAVNTSSSSSIRTTVVVSCCPKSIWLTIGKVALSLDRYKDKIGLLIYI